MVQRGRGGQAQRVALETSHSSSATSSEREQCAGDDEQALDTGQGTARSQASAGSVIVTLRALALLALEGDRAAVLLHERARDREPEARARESRPLAPRERKNRENTWPCSSAGIPIPVSATTSCTARAVTVDA